MVQLADNLTIGSVITGRVEVLYGGNWQPLCGDWDWYERNAQVVCRLLGYHSFEHEGTSMNIWLKETCTRTLAWNTVTFPPHSQVPCQ